MTFAAALAGAGEGTLPLGAHPLVHLNAALNTLATILLLVGLRQAKQRRYESHGRTMLAALVVSAVFLGCYLTYHYLAGSVRFTHPGAVRYAYYAILLSHVLLAFTVPPLALYAVWLGATAVGWRTPPGMTDEIRGQIAAKHRRLVRWAYPIWLYVSVTGVVVYAMLYHIWPSTDV